jgi:hypothetical protein
VYFGRRNNNKNNKFEEQRESPLFLSWWFTVLAALGCLAMPNELNAI